MVLKLDSSSARCLNKLKLEAMSSLELGLLTALGAACIHHGCSLASLPSVVIPAFVRSVAVVECALGRFLGCWRKPTLIRGLMMVTLSGAAYLVEGVIRVLGVRDQG
jgi:hypothetical protein